jgi:hypothetical protein
MHSLNYKLLPAPNKCYTLCFAMTFRNIIFAIWGCISSNLDGGRNWLKRTGLDYEARAG